MGKGFLRIQVTAGGGALPIANASVAILRPDGKVLYETTTNANGDTDTFSLQAPDKSYTLNPRYLKPAYSTCNVDVSAKGFVSQHISGVEIVDTQTAILPVNMLPLADEPNPVTDLYTNIPPVGLLVCAPYRKKDPPGRGPVIIPEYITVHLGLPTDASAPNVTVAFADYIKNVASSEIYSTWPYDSLVANIHAITTFALNRVYTEWYRGRGFNFDITNSTRYDQYFRAGGNIYENISQIVNNIFNVYSHRFAFRNPFFTQFCNGSTVTCPGLSQWGTVTLANQGMSPLEILRYYYPKDIQLTATDNIRGISESYPGYPLRLGSQGDPVQRMQNDLNRIRINFPLIPVISNPDGYFGSDTERTVRTFQSEFDLTVDGIIGRATWNKISQTFVGVTRLAELESEGIRYSIGMNPPNVVLYQGARGEYVLEMQFILNTVSAYFPSVPTVIMDSVFDARDKNSVIEFQKTFGLTPDGIVGPATWNKMYAVYRGIEQNVYIAQAT